MPVVSSATAVTILASPSRLTSSRISRVTNRKIELNRRIETRGTRVAVVGLGYVGLPLSVAIAEAGMTVVGIDVSPERVEAIAAGVSPIADVDSDVLCRLVESRSLTATTDVSKLAEVDVVLIAVPTPIDEQRVPDLSSVTAAAQVVAEHVRPGALVVLESTTYPGTTEEVVIPEFVARGFVPGLDLFVGYSPERIDPGNQKWHVDNTPKVVSGLTRDCLELTQAFYSTFVQRVVPVSTLGTAEITKLFENVFRIVNIALVNEFQGICESFGIDVWEVIEACSTKPFGFMPFYPGPGLGGHCVPVDPFYLAWKAHERQVPTEFIELAGRVNSEIAGRVVHKVSGLLNEAGKAMSSARIGVIGVAYKKNTADVRESPAIRIVEMLTGAGAEVSYHDPHVARFSPDGISMKSQPLTAAYLAAQDCVVILADHGSIDWQLITRHADVVLDTRNVLRRAVDKPPSRGEVGAAPPPELPARPLV